MGNESERKRLHVCDGKLTWEYYPYRCTSVASGCSDYTVDEIVDFGFPDGVEPPATYTIAGGQCDGTTFELLA